MRVSSLFAALLSIAVVVEASNEVFRSIPRKHSRSLRDNHPNRLTKRGSKRCAVKKPAANAANDKPSTTSKKPTSTPKPSSGGGDDNAGSSSSSGGIIHVTSSECPNNGATKEVTRTSGPNGNIDFFDCGIHSKGGWNPPKLTVDEAIVTSLSTALEDPKSPFQACKPYLSLFNKYAEQYGLKPIMLASTAMQESSCNPNAQGQGGEQGLMQISPDKCTGAPGGDCKETAFNIMKGAEYFAQTLKDNDDNLILALGAYNGFVPGMNYADATKAAHSSCCLCQNNLDYIGQVLNGYYQNKDPDAIGIGQYFNLKVCG